MFKRQLFKSLKTLSQSQTRKITSGLAGVCTAGPPIERAPAWTKYTTGCCMFITIMIFPCYVVYNMKYWGTPPEYVIPWEKKEE